MGAATTIHARTCPHCGCRRDEREPVGTTPNGPVGSVRSEVGAMQATVARLRGSGFVGVGPR